MDEISKKDFRIINMLMFNQCTLNYFHEQFCHIACLCVSHKICAIARNCREYHAEIATMKKIFGNKTIKKKKYLTLYVIKKNKCNKLFNSTPCYHCIHEIKKYKIIKRIVYTSTNGIVVSTKSKDLENYYVTRGKRSNL